MDNTQYTYKDSNLYNSRGDAVMMEWEREWMKISADIVCKNGGDVLNIGHGLGIVDSYIHENNPKSHWIIESHPDVHSHMKKNGWYDRANIIESRWQDVVNSLQSFDGIYFDTWGDSTDDFKIYYSTNGGSSYTLMQTYYGSPRAYDTWTTVAISLPSGAIGSSVKFKFENIILR